ncbi:MAG: ATP-NAD kinase, partial [Halioglobus sp.]|nr:ATP-NAD kinase [Halioglobus sp.]
MLHIGLLVNPLAGLGGSLALKGSDGPALRELAVTLPDHERRRASDRVRRALTVLDGLEPRIRFSTWGGAMGADALQGLGFELAVLGGAADEISCAADTVAATQSLREAGVDLLVFAGGDGTARDIADVVGTDLPVLGIPAGVKMHSGVFAVSPEAAGLLLCQLVQGELVGLRAQEVRDIDEEAFRNDIVRSRYYGELLVPGEGRFLQHTKVGGRESQELVAAEIGDWLAEQVSEEALYLLGPGSTTCAVKEALGMMPTLLGV